MDNHTTEAYGKRKHAQKNNSALPPDEKMSGCATTADFQATVRSIVFTMYEPRSNQTKSTKPLQLHRSQQLETATHSD
jgi:hypothetical protein